MKRIFTLLFLGGMMLNASAQNFEVKPRVDYVVGAHTEYELVLHGWIVNHGPDSFFTWKRIENTLQPGWTASICDDITCWLPTVDSSGLVIPVGDSSILDPHFYLDSTVGTGKIVIIVWSGTDRENADTAEFNASTWAASVSKLSSDKPMRVYPNPTQGTFQLEFATTSVVEVEIYDVLGKKLKTFAHSGLTSSFNVSDLPDGLYVIRVSENGSVYSRTFRKAN